MISVINQHIFIDNHISLRISVYTRFISFEFHALLTSRTLVLIFQQRYILFDVLSQNANQSGLRDQRARFRIKCQFAQQHD